MHTNITLTTSEYNAGHAFGASSVDAFPTSAERAGILGNLALRVIAYSYDHRDLITLAFAIGVRDGIEQAAGRHFDGIQARSYQRWREATRQLLPECWQRRAELLISLPVPADLPHGLTLDEEDDA